LAHGVPRMGSCHDEEKIGTWYQPGTNSVLKEENKEQGVKERRDRPWRYARTAIKLDGGCSRKN